MLCLTETLCSSGSLDFLAFDLKHWKAEVVSHASATVRDQKAISLCALWCLEGFYFRLHDSVCVLVNLCPLVCCYSVDLCVMCAGTCQ